MKHFEITPQELGNLLVELDLSGFTFYLKWYPKRYVVWFTSNKERTLELIAWQLTYYGNLYDTLTIGWRTDKHGEVMIDPGTATDNLERALALWKRFNQQCIWDSHKVKEIPCK